MEYYIVWYAADDETAAITVLDSKSCPFMLHKQEQHLGHNSSNTGFKPRLWCVEISQTS